MLWMNCSKTSLGQPELHLHLEPLLQQKDPQLGLQVQVLAVRLVRAQRRAPALLLRARAALSVFFRRSLRGLQLRVLQVCVSGGYIARCSSGCSSAETRARSLETCRRKGQMARRTCLREMWFSFRLPGRLGQLGQARVRTVVMAFSLSYSLRNASVVGWRAKELRRSSFRSSSLKGFGEQMTDVLRSLFLT